MGENYNVQAKKTTFGLTSHGVSHQVKSGETAFAIAKENGLSLKALQEANPGVNLNKLKVGQSIMLAGTSKSTKTAAVSTPVSAKTAGSVTSTSTSLFASSRTIVSDNPLSISHSTSNNSTKTSSGIVTLESFSENLSEEAKLLKPQIQKAEGKVTTTYVAPEGLATIGHGHLLINKPKFLTDIEKQKLTPSEKNKKVKEALQNNDNKVALKASLQKDLLDAIKTTGIKNVPSTVSNDLSLTDAQISLLLNSDVQKAQTAMEKQIGKENLKNRTAKQKLVALDMYYNVGSNLKAKAPSFVKYFKSGDIEKAQAEIDIFRTNKTIHLGLLRRNYQRMLLLNDNKLTPAAEQKLLAAYNQYLSEHNKALVSNFSSAEKVLKKA